MGDWVPFFVAFLGGLAVLRGWEVFREFFA